MNLREQVLAYIKNESFVICEPTLTANLAQDGWEKIAIETGISIDHYSIANCVGDLRPSMDNLLSLTVRGTEGILIEAPDFERLQIFYEEHGLKPLTAAELDANHVQNKLLTALELLKTIEPVYVCIRHLVKTIQVLRQDDAEIDTSYSHPKIPFSIFVSVCEDASLLSSLRVAESILHEAMHLHLTLLEDMVELICIESDKLYFSPWRDEDRPARGILHGIFVFRAVHDFYVAFAEVQNHPNEVKEYLIHRIKSIESELDSLYYFKGASDLTLEGKLLGTKLLEYYVFSCSQ